MILTVQTLLSSLKYRRIPRPSWCETLPLSSPFGHMTSFSPSGRLSFSIPLSSFPSHSTPLPVGLRSKKARWIPKLNNDNENREWVPRPIWPPSSTHLDRPVKTLRDSFIETDAVENVEIWATELPDSSARCVNDELGKAYWRRHDTTLTIANLICQHGLCTVFDYD